MRSWVPVLLFVCGAWAAGCGDRLPAGPPGSAVAVVHAADPQPHNPPAGGAGPIAQLAGWLRGLTPGMNDLSRAMVLMLALIAAFLTVVEVWQIPPGSSKVAPPASDAAGSTPAAHAAAGAPTAGGPGGQGAGAKSAAGPTAGGSSFLTQSNFARTVIAGIGGMLVISGLDATFWRNQPDAQPLYLVLFVVFFLILLVGSATLRGLGEAVRSRVLLQYRPPAEWHRPRLRRGRDNAALNWWNRFADWAAYWWVRFLRWLQSFKSTLLFFWDTFYNVIQGKNQLQTAIFEGEIVDLQASIVRTAHRVRTAIDQAVRDALERAYEVETGTNTNETEGKHHRDTAARHGHERGQHAPERGEARLRLHQDDIRVNLSVLSDDLASLSYISWAQGSLDKPFDQHSVAWVSVFTGEARWWNRHLPLDLVEIYDNSKKENISVPGPNRALMLDEYFQPREPMDYEAFIVLPIPWLRSVSGTGYRKAGIHISFAQAKHLDLLWEWKKLLPAVLLPEERHGTEGARVTAAGAPFGAAPHGRAAAAHSAAEKAAEQARWQHYYSGHGKLLSEAMMPDPALRAVLRESVDVLSEVLRGFNQTIYESHIRPSQRT